jgi:hypothetical protein
MNSCDVFDEHTSTVFVMVSSDVKAGSVRLGSYYRANATSREIPDRRYLSSDMN